MQRQNCYTYQHLTLHNVYRYPDTFSTLQRQQNDRQKPRKSRQLMTNCHRLIGVVISFLKTTIQSEERDTIAKKKNGEFSFGKIRVCVYDYTDKSEKEKNYYYCARA